MSDRDAAAGTASPDATASAAGPDAAASAAGPDVAASAAGPDAARRADAPSPGITRPAAETSLPGAHRGGFARLPTAPVGVTPVAPETDGTGGKEETDEPDEQPFVPAQWIMPDPTPDRGLSAWALAFAIGGLAFSLFVGWAFPIGVVGVIIAIFALRQPLESRSVAIWALVLAIVSVLYSVGWLLWAASRADLLG